MKLQLFVMDVISEWQKVHLIGPIPNLSRYPLFWIKTEFGIFVVDGREICYEDETGEKLQFLR